MGNYPDSTKAFIMGKRVDNVLNDAKDKLHMKDMPYNYECIEVN